MHEWLQEQCQPKRLRAFCDCIYNQGNPLTVCLNEYQKVKDTDTERKRQSE